LKKKMPRRVKTVATPAVSFIESPKASKMLVDKGLSYPLLRHERAS
jgi:hypothetical protein